MAVVLALVCAAGIAQSTADGSDQAEDVGFSDRVAVEWVSVATIVEPSKKRRQLPTLEPGMFRLYVDGREVEVEEFEPSGEIVHLLYLQDVSGSMALQGRLPIARRLYGRLVDQLIPGDDMAVGSFAARRARMQQDFTDDHSLLRGLEHDWRGYGETALIDTAATIPQLVADRWGRTTALLVTDGIDNASELPVDQVETLLSSSGVPVYVYGVSGASGKGAESSLGPDDASPTDLRNLRDLARATGGRYVNLTETSVEQAVSRILNDIRNRVFLGFPTQTDSARSMHTVEVRFLEKGGVVNHRTHYFGYSPRAWSETP